MKATFDIVLSMCEKYIGDSWHMILLAAAILYLLITVRRQKEHLLFVLIAVVFGFVFLCPITAKIIMKYCVGKSVYWRMLWVLPAAVIIAYAGATFLGQIRRRKLRPLLLAVMAIVIGLTGSCMYLNGNYAEAANVYKLPYPTAEICDMISADAAEQNVPQVKVTVPNELLCYIRQYDASFLMPYGRNALKLEDLTQNQEGLYAQMNNPDVQAEVLNMHLRTEGCNYLVWNRQDEIRQELEEYGFVPIGDIEEYRIYRIV